MAAPHNGTASETAGARSAATRFFWLWLILATAMSIAGNVTHAVLVVEHGTALLAAGAALVPPVVLLAATHSVALLVRSRVGGAVYWSAVLMTLALAASAFVLSFTALRGVAVTVGVPEPIAWLWPCAIDVAIAQATLCLLSVGRPGTGRRPDTAPVRAAMAAPVRGEQPADVVTQNDSPPEVGGPADDRRGDTRGPSAGDPEEQRATRNPAAASVQRWRELAESLIREGVTSKDADLVATILAERDAGVPPSTIGRTHGVHHTTVNRILSAATTVTGSADTPIRERVVAAPHHEGAA